MWSLWTRWRTTMSVIFFGFMALSLGVTAGEGAAGGVTATPITPPEFPCKIVDGEHEYDLSELGLRDYWKVVDTMHTSDRKVMYLSMCHPLRNVSNLCDTENSAGVCIVKTTTGNDSRTTEEAYVRNAGQVSRTGPDMTAFGWLEYTYDNGQKCTHFGRNYNYTTSIHFRCANHPDEETPGPVLMTNPGCNLVFAWMTKAACPKKLQKSDPKTCRVNFSNSNHQLNVHSLHSPQYYNVSSSKNEYEINICGPVTGGHCPGNTTVCDVSDISKPTVLATTDTMDLEWKNNILQLLYKDDGFTVEIQLFCDRSAHLPVIYYHSKNATNLVFSVKTAAVCTPDIPECVVKDDDENVYDLRSLHKAEGNWFAKYPDSNAQDMGRYDYLINICGEVNEVVNAHCPAGLIGACQASYDSTPSVSLGLLTSDPHVNDNGTITVTYTGGDPCQKGQHARSTRITLICNPEELGPELVKVTETCEYIFNWLTPAACPRHLVSGSLCQVTDPLYGNVYDLNPLRNNKIDYNVTGDQRQFLVNLCGPLVAPCQGEKDKSGVCEITGDSQHSVGLKTSDVTFNDGTLIVDFVNGTAEGCSGNQTRSSRIVFLCDQEKSGLDGPIALHDDASCGTHFIWQTMHACPPYRAVDCSYITEKGVMYDLSELSSSAVNEEYYTKDGSKKFVLNVCRSVVHSKLSRCPYNAAACIVDLQNKNQSVNIGEVSSGPRLENGTLKLKYTNGDPCEGSDEPSETIIEFKCDKDVLYPYPQFIIQEGCKYLFQWSTPIACPLTAAPTRPTNTDGNCTVVNPYSNYVFDLNPLKKDSGYQILDDNKLHLIINVCDKVSTDNCGVEGTGACSFTDDNTDVVNAGMANGNLVFHPGFLFLQYTGGDLCESNIQRTTYISFICGAEGSSKDPVLIHDDRDKCIYYVNWYTELACERRINCFVDADRRINLTPLIKRRGNYEAQNPQNPKEKFYVNVCRPLNPVIGLNCNPGSAACLSTTNGSEPLSLGHAITSLVYSLDNGEDKIEMMYSHGSSCPAMPVYDVTTRITFLCDRSVGEGSPVFQSLTDDCQYQFEWRTSLLCKEVDEVPDSGPQCQVMFEDAKTNVNLRPLQRPEGYQVPFDNKVFNVNVCGPACDSKSGVCTGDGSSYGLSDKSDLRWDYDKLKLTYYGGDTCPGALSGRKTTAIYFECDMSAGFGKPTADDLMRNLECLALFQWKTNVTCIEGIYSTDTSDEKPYKPAEPSSDTDNKDNSSGNENSSSSAEHQKDEATEQPYHTVSVIVSSVLVVSGIVFVIILILFKSEWGQRVMASARRLVGIRGYTNIAYSGTESSTLLGPTSSVRVFKVDESDDDLLKV